MAYNMPDSHPQIEYVEEDPWIRERFEADLTESGLTTRMPDEAYTDPNFKFTDPEMQGD